MLGQVAFERLLEKMAGRDAESPAERGQAAWLEINETTAPPPEIAYHILPNRTRLATSQRHLEAAIAPESPTAAR